MNRLSIVLVAVIAVLLGLIIYGSQREVSTPRNTDKLTSVKDTSQAQTGDLISTSSPNIPQIVIPGPVGGRLKAIVELGSDGFNYFIVEIDGKKDWELVKPVYNASLSKENILKESGLVMGLRNFIREIVNFGVESADVHFAVSSGAQKNENIVRYIEGLKELGYIVNAVDYQKEAESAWLAAVPKSLREESFVVDIGSGNTKVAWLIDGKLNTRETYGSKYYEDGISDHEVVKAVNSIAVRIPVGNTSYCFIIGGVPYNMSKKTKIGNERFTYFQEASTYQLEGKKNSSGLKIYDAFRRTTRCEKYIFDSHANFTIGYLLSLPY